MKAKLIYRLHIFWCVVFKKIYWKRCAFSFVFLCHVHNTPKPAKDGELLYGVATRQIFVTQKSSKR